jgi:hypothetical protein
MPLICWKNGDGGCCGDSEKCSLVIVTIMMFMIGPVSLFTGIGCAVSGDLKSRAVKSSNTTVDFQKLPLGCQLEDVQWKEALKGSGKDTYCYDSYTCVLHRKRRYTAYFRA